MAKINNRDIYKNIDLPSLLDFLLGTKEVDGKTKSFPLQSVIQLINGVNGTNNVQLKFSDGTDPDTDYLTEGRFFTDNNNTIVNSFSKLIFNKETVFPINISQLFNKLGDLPNIVLRLDNPEDPNNFFNFKVVSFEDHTEYFVFGVETYNDLYLGDLKNEQIYSLYFSVSSDLPEDFSRVVYFNSTEPTTATIFDLNNPPVTNDNSLKANDVNLYVASDATTWVYKTSTASYETKVINSNSSNFYLSGTTIDSGGSKTVAIERSGTVGGAQGTAPNHFVTKSQHDLKANDDNVLHKTGNETKNGGLDIRGAFNSGSNLFSSINSGAGTAGLFVSNSGLALSAKSIGGNRIAEFSTNTLMSYLRSDNGALALNTGLATQFLKADGSVDANIYALNSNVLHKTGNETKEGYLTFAYPFGGTPSGIIISNGSVVPKSSYGLDVQVINAGGGIKIDQIDNNSGSLFSIRNQGIEKLEITKEGNIVSSGLATFVGTVSGATPTAANHLVTKAYADNLVVGMLNLRGSYDASSNLYPTTGGSGVSGAIRKGDLWYVSVAGILSGKAVNVGDSFVALSDAPGQTFANWNVMESNIGYVPANDANVVHLTGAESIGAGRKTFNSANAILVNASSTNPGNIGISINETGGQTGLQSTSNTGTAIYASSNTGRSIVTLTNGSGVALNLQGTDISTGDLIDSDSAFGATGNQINLKSQLVSAGSFSSVFVVSRIGDVIANKYTKKNGLSTQFLKADGSIDSTTYISNLNGVLLTSTNQNFNGIKSSINSGSTQINGLVLTNNGTSNNSGVLTMLNNSTGVGIYGSNPSGKFMVVSGGAGENITSAVSNGKAFVAESLTGTSFDALSTAGFTYVGRNSSGTISYKVDFAGNTTANSFIKTGGLATEYLKADGSVTTNVITGTGAANYIPKSTGTGTLVNSVITDNGTIVTIGNPTYVNQINPNTGDVLGLLNGGTNKLYVNGNVGIGTANPLHKFVVSNNNTNGFEIYVSTTPSEGIAIQSYDRLINDFRPMQYLASSHSFSGGNATFSGTISTTGIVSSYVANNALVVYNSMANYTSLNTFGDSENVAGNVGFYSLESLRYNDTDGVQKITYINGTNVGKLYVRVKNAGTWTAWVEK